jgi:hypothetical protein
MHQTRPFPPELDRDSRYQLAKRVAQSQHFQKAPRLKDFLLYVCEQTIQGHTENLSEQKIGHQIFERAVDYSPADDSIVRVQARQLRLRLSEYFHGEGHDEKSIIEIPKGSYSAVFHETRATYEPEPEPRAATPRPLSRTAKILVAGVLVALTVACLLLYLQNRQLRAAAGNGPSGFAAGAKPWLLARIFENSRTNTVVLSDSAFGNIQGMLGREFSLEDYLRPGYPQSILPANVPPEYPHFFATITTYPLASFTQTIMVERLAKLAERFGWQYALRHSRDLAVRDLAVGNQLIFGSRMSNPWISLYERNLQFQSFWDDQNKVIYFRDTAPPGGRPAIYASAGPNGIPGSAFAVIGLLTGPQPSSEHSRVLTLRSTKGEALEAAWDLVTDPSRMEERLKSAGFKAAPVVASSNFEILLETKALAGSHGEVVIRAVRLH